MIYKSENDIYENWINLESLPKKKHGGKETIDWASCDGEHAEFMFYGNRGHVSIFKHPKHKHCLVRFKGKKAILSYENLKKVGLKNFFPNVSIPKKRKNKELINHKPLLHNLVDLDVIRSKNIHTGSRERINFKCSSCGCIKEYQVQVIVRQGFHCERCEDSRSYPEKIMASVLIANNILFEEQKRFNECRNKLPLPFDFYLPKENAVIEMNGIQHYEENSLFNSVNTKRHDRIKKQYCKQYGIKYIEIDCSLVRKDVILGNIRQQTGLNTDNLAVIETKLDINSIVGDINKNITTSEIARKYSVSEGRIRSIRHRENTVKKKGVRKQKPVVCLNDKKVYCSMAAAGLVYNIRASDISLVCSNKRRTAGKHPINQEKIRWMLLEEYLQKYKESDLIYEY